MLTVALDGRRSVDGHVRQLRHMAETLQAPARTSSSPARSVTSGRGSMPCRWRCSSICGRGSSRSGPRSRTRLRSSSPGPDRRARTASSPGIAWRASGPAFRRPGCECRSAATFPRRPGSGAAPRPRSRACVSTRRSPRRDRSEDWLAMATELEGHPDNAAAALLGGITVSCQREDGATIARSSRWPEAIKLVVATPELGLHTAHARRVLPTDVPLAGCDLQPPARAADAARAALGPLRRPARGDEGSLASARAHRSRAWPRRSHRLRRSGRPRRLPERRRPLDRGPRHGRGRSRPPRSSTTCTSAWDCRVRSELCPLISPAFLDLHSK